MSKKYLTKEEKTRIPKVLEAHRRKQEKQPGILKAMIFKYGWWLTPFITSRKTKSDVSLKVAQSEIINGTHLQMKLLER